MLCLFIQRNYPCKLVFHVNDFGYVGTELKEREIQFLIQFLHACLSLVIGTSACLSLGG